MIQKNNKIKNIKIKLNENNKLNDLNLIYYKIYIY